MNYYIIIISALVVLLAFNFYLDYTILNNQTALHEIAIKKWEAQIAIDEQFVNTHKQLWKGIFG